MTAEETDIEKMTLEEIEAAAESKVKQEVWEWINGGTETGFTLHRNRLALEKILFRVRVIHGLETVNTSAEILGQTVQTPVIVAPFANMGRVHPKGEMAIAEGAREAGAMMFLGPVSAYPIEEIVRACTAPVVWNGEPLRDRERLLARMRQAEKAGCRAVSLCVDDFTGIKIKDRLLALPNKSLSPEELREIRRETSLPFVIKGIMTAEDALSAAEAGADAVVVSNHGGRVLDYCQAPIEVLPEIVKALDGRIEVLIDGGFRRGTDVLKALALGAKGVLVGRPICWGLGAAGAKGVARVLGMLTSELARSMFLTNTSDVNHVPGDVIVRDCL